MVGPRVVLVDHLISVQVNIQREIRFYVVLDFHERLVVLRGVALLVLTISLVLEPWREVKVVHWLLHRRHVHVEVGTKSGVSLRGIASHLNLVGCRNSLMLM
jgi:uncharacterized membrane protein YjgN (DUF898 family)